MKIYDCFPFFNELELLKIRCEELKHLDVTHVLVESTLTHSGNTKPLYFNDNKSLYSDYNIVHLIIEFPETKDNWVRERFQRESIYSKLKELTDPDDIVIISDADEIPRAETILNAQVETPRHLRMDNFYYYLNLLTSKNEWTAAFISKFKHLKEGELSKIRVTEPRLNLIENAGWHFGWLGGYERILYKFNSFAHSDLDSKYANIDRIKSRVDQNKVFFHDGDNQFTVVPINQDTHPKYLVDNISSYNHLIK